MHVFIDRNDTKFINRLGVIILRQSSFNINMEYSNISKLFTRNMHLYITINVPHSGADILLSTDIN